ncbi:MAG: hypothetical protein JKY37_25685 [Nannocystaceae bacterium]|nr:hypothetical protein [Nannocystaceae bacterium]
MGELAEAVSGHVVYNRESGSSFVVAVIPEFHHLPRCQDEVYATLEALRPVTTFVAVEGKVGELKHDEIHEPVRVPGLSRSALAELVTQEPAVRRAVVAGWRAEGMFPVSDPGGVPVHAAVLYEAVYGDEVRSQGMERYALFLRANRMAARYQRGAGPLPWTTVIASRNRVFVEKLRHYGEYLASPGRDVVPFPIGAAHTNDLTRRLRRSGISYAIVVNPACFTQHR